MCGVRSEAIQKKLLAEDGLTLARALELSQGMEAVGKQAKELHERSSSTVLQVGRKQNREKAADDKSEQRRCHRCGRNNHRADDYRFKQAKCHKCGKVGHIAPACRSKEKQPFRRSNHKDNGLVERFVQSLKQSLKSTQNDGRSLNQRVYSYLLTYRISPHATTGVSPSKLFLQRDIRTRLDLLKPNPQSTVTEKQEQQKLAHDRGVRNRE